MKHPVMRCMHRHNTRHPQGQRRYWLHPPDRGRRRLPCGARTTSGQKFEKGPRRALAEEGELTALWGCWGSLVSYQHAHHSHSGTSQRLTQLTRRR